VKGPDDEVIFASNARLALVYPMKKEDDGTVRMRCKRVDTTTGDISLTWITVYDEKHTPKRLVTSFSALS
jgi:hypothetical protein